MGDSIVAVAIEYAGLVFINMRRQFHKLITEQVVIYVGKACPMDAAAFREGFYDDFFDTSTPLGRHNKALCRQLFNGDIRKRGVVEHYENGCCEGQVQTVNLMVGPGVNAIMGRKKKY